MDHANYLATVQGRVVLATVTFYKEESLRSRLAQQTIEKATAAGYSIIVVDGSPNDLIKSLSGATVKVVPEITYGLGAAKRLSFFMAMEYAYRCIPRRDIVVHLEAEKDDMIRWIPTLVAPIIGGAADVVVAERSAASWQSYPEFQAKTEAEGNFGLLSATGLDVDIFVGPGAFHIERAGYYFVNAAPYLAAGLEQGEDTYAQHFGAISAHAHNCSVVASELLDFIYPPEQKADEEGGALDEKRIWQRGSLIATYQKLARHFGLPHFTRR